MSRTVFILGAGASKEAGAPLMNDFLDVAEEIKNAHSQDLSPEEKEWFGGVFEGLYELQKVHEKATLNTLNVEDVFAAFEMAILVKKLGGLSQEKIGKLDKAMRKVIAKTLETAIEFPIHDTKTLLPPPSYKNFVYLLDELGKHSGGIDQISIITFNYDLALDYALYYGGKPFDYGIIDRSRPILSLFKLHGSLNWAKCQKCGLLQSWQLSDFFKDGRLGTLYFTDNEIAKGRLRFSAYLNQYRHSDLCEGLLESEPAIVPPTWIKKSEYSVTLSNV